MRGQQLSDPIYPPASGRWIICGYGRFGKAIYKRLKAEGLDIVVIEQHPEITGQPEEGCVLGRGTEAVTLVEAGISDAVGLVAGTDDDANNLSIIMTARELNTELFVVARQNQIDNQRIFDAVDAHMVMHPSSIIANKIRVLLGTPLLYEFASLVTHEEDAWACELISRISALVHDHVPAVWEVGILPEHTEAVVDAIEADETVTLRHLLCDPQDRESELPCLPLLMLRQGNRIILPELDRPLLVGDRLLLCGQGSARSRMEWTLKNEHSLSYVTTGESRPQGWVWRTFFSDTKRDEVSDDG